MRQLKLFSDPLHLTINLPRMRPVLLLSIAFIPFLLSAQFAEPYRIEGDIWGGSNYQSADLDQDADLDLVAHGGNELFWLQKFADDHYDLQRRIITSSDPITCIATADLNGDGVVDIAMTTDASPAISWLKNSGFAEFEGGGTVTSSLLNASWIRAADMDNDGDMDLVVASSLQDRLVVNWNDGLGNFNSEVIVENALDIPRFFLGDIDGNGNVDIAAANTTGQSLVAWMNGGQGEFSMVTTMLTGVSFPHLYGIQDMNGDGSNDLLFKRTGTLEWIPNMGDGNFGAPVVVHTMNGSDGAWAGDVDGDGDMDAVSSIASSLRVHVNDGTGSFSTSIISNLGQISEVIIRDENEDGLPDVLARINVGYTINIHYNEGNNIFGTGVKVPYSTPPIIWCRGSDADDDGDIDLFVRHTNNAPVWLDNEGGGIFRPRMTFEHDGESLEEMIIQDFDNDGMEDILYRVEGPNLTAELFWRRNEGGTFAQPQILTTQHSTLNGQVALADMDSDGDLDHLVRKPHVGWHRNDGNSFSGLISILPSYTNSIIGVADLDGDGHVDLWARNSSNGIGWYKNDGSGDFSFQGNISASSTPPCIIAGDLDSDGDNDLIVTPNNVTGTAEILMNDGTGSFTYSGEFDPISQAYSWMSLADVDDDGDLDIVNWTYFPIRIHLNNGLGEFTSLFSVGLEELYEYTTAFTMADLNGDQLDDIIYSNGTALKCSENLTNSLYRIEGHVYVDLDVDGVRDANEPLMPNVTMTVSPDAAWPVSLNNGKYICHVDSGTFTVSPSLSGIWDLGPQGGSYTITVGPDHPISIGNDFGIVPQSPAILQDLSINGNWGICGDEADHYITVTNLGNQSWDGSVVLTPDTLSTLLYTIPLPDEVDTMGRSHWHFSELQPNGTLNFILRVVRPDAEHIGSTSTTKAELFMADTLAQERTLAFPITCSFDPNDKLVDPPGYGEAGYIPFGTDRLNYTVRFQNTGTAVAHHITIKDTLSDKLDLGTLQVHGHSHAVTDISIGADRVLSIRFQGINLPDSASDMAGSQGFISFGFALLPGLTHMTPIENSAAIHFDLNEPVITNTVLNTLVDCSLWQPQITVIGELMVATEGDSYQWYLNGEPLVGFNTQQISTAGEGDYTVSVISGSGCTATSDPVISTSIPIETGGNVVILQPNPASDHITLFLKEPIKGRTVCTLMNAQGSTLNIWDLPAGIQQYRINRSGIANGTYFLRIGMDDGTIHVMRLIWH